jgi:hypothetical protein
VILSIKEDLFIIVFKNLSFERKTSRIELYVKIKIKRGNNILELRSSKFIQEFDLSILE